MDKILILVGENMNQEKTKKLNNFLPPGHMTDTFYKEHEIILSFLDKLEKNTQKIQKMKAYQIQDKEWQELKHIAEHLIGAELHHQREEKVLFPELEKAGVLGPPEVMRGEHEELRKYKHQLEELVKKVNKNNFSTVKQEVKKVSEFLIFNLRNHIAKENEILYPMALEVIKEKDTWQKMKLAADKIGYCCFTPQQA